MAKSVKIFKGNEIARQRLTEIAQSIYDQLRSEEIPSIEVSSRTKGNIVLSDEHNVWKYGEDVVERSAKDLGGATGILRSLYTAEFIMEMIHDSKSSTLREMYYISEGWNKAKFPSQDDSNKLAEDLEIITKCMREDFKLRPEEDGARVIGNITIEELNRKGELKKINCKDDVGDSGYGIPYNVEPEKVKFKSVDGPRASQGPASPVDAQVHQEAVRILEPPRRSLHRRRPLVIPDLRIGRVRCDQDCAYIGVPGHPVGAVPRDDPVGHRELRASI
jgi:DNA topoisomerase VI subunit A